MTSNNFPLEHSHDNTDILLCPTCGEGYMHLLSVETFDVSDSGSRPGIHVHAPVESVSPVMIDSDVSRNPSARRSGALLAFVCEFCSPEDWSLPTHVISLANHKGGVYVEAESMDL